MATYKDSSPFYITITDFPSWYPAVGAIADISSSTQRDFLSAYGVSDGSTNYPARTYQSNMLDPYSGGVLLRESGIPYFHAMGGGHDDGSWNGTCKFGPLYGAGSDTPAWSIGAPASIPSVIQIGVGVYSDGKPASQHTYDCIDGSGSCIYAGKISAFYGNPAGGQTTPYRWDSSTNTWTIWNVSPPFYDSTGHGGGAAVYYNGKIFYYEGAGYAHPLKAFDINSQTWSQESGDSFVYGDTMLAFDSNRGALLALGHNSTVRAVYWADISNFPNNTGRRTTVSTSVDTDSSSLVYNPDEDIFVVPIPGTQSIQYISAATLAAGQSGTWSTRTFTGATPSAQKDTGTFGRFQYIPELKGYINIPKATSHVYFYRSA